ncbi:MAG TPA: hypothetical protein DDY78_25380 [Planctomycetales bacterium]|jgi:hypothetical protein|nr:hypothetical protein [Planctomycetales bacterium]
MVGIGLAAYLARFLLPTSLAADLPKTIESAACNKAPTIDGVLGEEEWNEAATIKFDMPMIQVKPAAVKEKRACELRVMNSANALYIALRVPNAAVHKSLEPLELDMASLAFCQGKDVAKGDLRKVLAVGMYVDKHVVEPGKDEDDPRHAGRGAVAYDKGYYTFEWAVPLNDLRAKPGDEFRFNIAFFDCYRDNLKDTQVGGMFGADLNKATAWGTLRLADKVTFTKDPEGRATMGGSSGAAAAFTMAWFRPDLYRRVLSYSGTYVDQQSPMNPQSPHGAWEYHEHLIRMSDAKPLRVWLEVGEKDNGWDKDEQSYHNWVLANDRMAAALKEKKYHYRYVFASGAGHVDGKAVNQTLPEAMLWLWQGYPIK